MTSSTEPVVTTGGPMVCPDPPVNTQLVVEVTRNGAPYQDCVLSEDQELEGLLFMTGTSMSLRLAPDCMPGDPQDELVLASGLDLPALDPVCVRVTIRWDGEGVHCKLGLLQVHDAETDKILYVGAFRLDPPDDFPLHTNGFNVTSCGCPEDEPECCEPRPGILDLAPSNGKPVAQGEHGYAKLKGVEYDFYNLQSWVDPTCVLGDDHGRHIDWLAVVVEGG
jgi:hypothetical protein